MTLIELFYYIRHLPQRAAAVARQRRLQVFRDDQEVERLDRIRNPSKYRGK